MFRLLRLSALLLGVLTISHGARADASSNHATDRAQFIAVTQIAQMPAPEQAQAVPQLYELLAQIPRTLQLTGEILYTSLPWRTPDHEKLTPEAQADLAEKQGNAQYFSTESGQLACKTLKKYPAQTMNLLHDDLRSDDQTRQLRGVSNLEALKSGFGILYDAEFPQKQDGPFDYASFYPEIVRIFRSAPPAPAPTADKFGTIYTIPLDEQPLKAQAESALMKMGRADTIALLINDDAAQPLLHYEAIYFLASRMPDDAALQRLIPFLKSDDAELRYRAIYALPIASPAVRAALPALIDDADAKVRREAVFRAFWLKGAEFEALEPRLKSKLEDGVAGVRLVAATGFAERNDASAAPVLLRLLRDHQDDPSVNSWWAGEALSKLTGLNKNFPYQAGDPNNAAAFARIEAWIALHPAN